MLSLNQIIQRDGPGLGDVLSYTTSDGRILDDRDVMSHAFWLNDLLFEIAPSSIVAQSEDTIYQWQGLRTANSTKVHSGRGTRVFSITVDVPSKSAIKNVDFRTSEPDVVSDGDNTGKRGGLLDLIIQFKNIPFARIENAFLRAQLRIPADRNMAFCLHSMNLSTIPGEPGTARVRMTVTVFNYSPFSDRWGYREDWRAADMYGNVRMDDVNTIDLPGRDRYKLVTSQVAADFLYNEEGFEDPANNMSVRGGETYDRIDRNLMNPAVRNYVDGTTDEISPVEVNIDMAESDNALWPTERQYMATTVQVMNPAFSSIYKDYIDWLHYEWTKIEDIDSPSGFDCTKISPYGTNIQNLGDELVFKWREYKRFDMPTELTDQLRAYIRDRVLDLAVGIEERTLHEDRPGQEIDAFAGGTPQTWLDQYVTGATGDYLDARSTGRADDPSTQDVDESVRYHQGVDLRFDPRASLYSPFDGTVTAISDYTYRRSSPRREMDYGGTVTIQSSENENVEIYIRHIKDVVVAEGDSVQRGDRIGSNYYADPNREFNTVDGITDTDRHNRYIRENRMPGGDRAHAHVELEVDGRRTHPNQIDLRGLIDPAHVPASETTPEAPPENQAEADQQDVNQVFDNALDNISAFAAYIQEHQAEGWTFYAEDLTRYDTFYREHELVIPSNSSVHPPVDGNPIVCSHININLRNLFKQIPLNGAPYPTAQYLGKFDDDIMFGFEGIGLNHIKRLTSLGDVLRRQAINFKSIPDSWIVRCENNLVNATGNRYFVINGIDSATVPESPDLYSIEMRLVANTNRPEATRLSYVGSVSPANVKRAFVDGLVGYGDDDLSFLKIGGDSNRNRRNVLTNVIQVNEARINDLALPDPQKNQFREYVQLIAATLNTANSWFMNWDTILRPSDFEFTNSLVSIPEIRTANESVGTINAFGFGGETGGSPYLFRAGAMNGQGFSVPPSRDNAISPYDQDNGFVNVPWNYNARSAMQSRPIPARQGSQIEGLYRQINEDPLLLISAGDLEGEEANLLRATLNTTFNARNRWISNVDNSYSDNITDNSSSLFTSEIGRFVQTGYYTTWVVDDGAPVVRMPYIQLHRAVYAWMRTLNMWGAVNGGHPSYDGVSYNWSLGSRLNRGFAEDEGVQGSQDISDITYGLKLTNSPSYTFPLLGYFYGDVTSSSQDVRDYLWTPEISEDDIWTSPADYTQLDTPNGEFYERTLPTEYYADFLNSVVNSPEFQYGLSTFEAYMLNNVALPMIANTLDMGQIEKWLSVMDRNQNLVFEDAYDLSQGNRVNSVGPAYKDILLPLHPFWEGTSTVIDSRIWTDPDFYLYSAGIDGNAESAVPVGRNTEDGVSAYNRLIQTEIELSIESLERLRPDAASAPRFTAPDNALNPHQNRNAGFEFEFGFNARWAPGFDESNEDNQFCASMDNYDANENGERGDSLGGNLRNASIYTVDREASQNPWAEDFDDEATQAFVLEDNLSYGMLDIFEQNSGASHDGFVDWREVAPFFGLNPSFVDTPPGFDRSYVGRANFWGLTRKNPVDVISGLQASRDLEPYNFMVEAPPGSDNSDEFIPGNWGYSEIGQWSNTRFAIYDKVREALKSIGTKKWVAKRAFPTFKIFLIEEDSIEHEWVVYDDLYTYDQVESINISDSRKRPASLATITFLNIGGVLDGHNMWNAAQRVQPGENLTEDEQRELARRSRSEQGEEGTRFEQNPNGFIMDIGTKIKIKMGFSNHSDRLREMFIGEVTEVKFMEEGNKVAVVCQSYGTELVARSKGTSKKELRKTYHNTFDLLAHMMFEPEVLHFGKKKRDTVSLSVENQSIASNEIIHKNSFGRRPLRSVVGRIGEVLLRSGLAFTTYGVSEAALYVLGELNDYLDKTAQQVRITPLDGPQDDNIFTPHFSREQRYRFFSFRRWRRTSVVTGYEIDEMRDEDPNIPNEGAGAGADNDPASPGDETNPTVDYRYLQTYKKHELEYNIFYSTIWGLFNEMTLRHPGFVKHARPYGNSTRMTMFFGLPDQRYWSKEPLYGSVAFGETLFDSMIWTFRPDTEDGESRGSGGSAGGVEDRTTRNDRGRLRRSDLDKFMSLVQRRFRPFRDWHHVNSVTDIVSNNMIANKYGFYTGVDVQFVAGRSQRRLRAAIRRLGRSGRGDANKDTINPNGFVRFRDKHTEEMLAHRDLSADNIRTKFHEFPNCRGRTMARRYGRALLANYAKEMYKGSLLILGNPDIKPYDVVIINDTYNDISGPIEVEEVVHMFSPQTGYLTEIIPDTFIIQEDIAPMVLLNALRPTVMMKTEKYLEQALFTHAYDQPDDTVLNIIADTYRNDYAIERNDVTNAFESLRDAILPGISDGSFNNVLALGDEIGVPGGIGIATGVGAIALGASAPVTLTAGAVAALGSSAAIWAVGNFYINNYVARRRAFMMVPLIKSGKPWVSGFELTATNSYYRGMFDMLRRWWDGGVEGLNLMVNDRLIANQRVRDMYGDDLTWLAGATLNWNEVGPSFRRVLNNSIDNLAAPNTN